MPSSLMTKSCSLGCICPPQGFIEVAYRYYLLHIALFQLLRYMNTLPLTSSQSCPCSSGNSSRCTRRIPAYRCLSVSFPYRIISKTPVAAYAPPPMKFAREFCWYCRFNVRHVPSVYGLAGISSFLISIFSVLYKGLLPLLRPSPATCSLPLHSLLYGIVRWT